MRFYGTSNITEENLRSKDDIPVKELIWNHGLTSLSEETLTAALERLFRAHSATLDTIEFHTRIGSIFVSFANAICRVALPFLENVCLIAPWSAMASTNMCDGLAMCPRLKDLTLLSIDWPDFPPLDFLERLAKLLNKKLNSALSLHMTLCGTKALSVLASGLYNSVSSLKLAIAGTGESAPDEFCAFLKNTTKLLTLDFRGTELAQAEFEQQMEYIAQNGLVYNKTIRTLVILSVTPGVARFLSTRERLEHVTFWQKFGNQEKDVRLFTEGLAANECLRSSLHNLAIYGEIGENAFCLLVDVLSSFSSLHSIYLTPRTASAESLRNAACVLSRVQNITFNVQRTAGDLAIFPILQRDVERSIDFISEYRDDASTISGTLSRRNRYIAETFSKKSLYLDTELVGMLLLCRQLPLYVVLRIAQFYVALKAERAEQSANIDSMYWHGAQWFADYLDQKKRAFQVAILQGMEKVLKRREE